MGTDQMVTGIEVDRDDPSGFCVAECAGVYLLYDTSNSGHEDVGFGAELGQGQNGGNILIGTDGKERLNVLPPGGSAYLWDLMNLHPVCLAETGNEHDGIVGGSHKEVFHKVMVLERGG